jgi:NAD(P)-dependent dehydrogenase (short-subunit alcohol dehydrogenase family)
MNPVMIVTGGARGIGAARGYTVCINYRSRRDAAEEAVREIASANGHAVAIQADVAREADVLKASAKGAIDTFTIGLATEVAQVGIRVNAVRPGFIYTELHAKAGEPKRVDRVKTLVPMQRGGQPKEVANAILWLLSEEASYITGTIVDVSGGR